MWVNQKEYVRLGAVLADAREKAGLTQQQLARRLRKPQSFISNYERGQRRIDVLELLYVVDALNCDPAEILRKILPDRAAKSRK